MRRFKNSKALSILVIIIIVLALLFGVSALTSGSTNIVFKTINSGLSYIVEPISQTASSISRGIKGIFDNEAILKENEELKARVLELEEELMNERVTQEELNTLRDLSAALNVQGEHTYENIVTASVTATESINWMSTFTINAGEDQGILEEDIVVYGNNLIGKVVEVGKNYAKVSTILDYNNRISFYLAENMNAMGVITGVEGAAIKGYMLNAAYDVAVGDEIITTGMALYPKGLVIGKISEVQLDSSKQLVNIEINHSAPIESLEKVTVIR